MNDIPMTAPTLRAGTTGERRRSRSGQRRLNSVLFWALLALVAVAPLPFGSVRPIFWGAWAFYVGLVGAAYFAISALRGEQLRISPGKLIVPLALFAATCLYLAFQLMPIGEVPIITANGVTLAAPQISIAPSMTLLMLLRQLAFGLFAFLVMQVSLNDGRRALLLMLLLTVVILYAIYALIALQAGDTILGLPKWAYPGSATGPFVNRNSFATFVGFGAILALVQGCAVLVRQSQRHAHDGHIVNFRSSIVLFALAYGFLLVVLVATQSRMGLFATLAGSALVILVTMLTIGRLGFALVAVPVGLALLAAALYLVGGGLFERIANLEFSAEVRTNLYAQVLELIAMRPWTGFGGGTFELAFPLVHQLPVSPDVTWNKAHNTYLTLWSELGLVAGSLPILAVGYLAFRMLRSLIRREGSWSAQTAGLGVIALGAVHSLVDFSLEIPANTLLFLAIVAAGTATTTITGREG